MGGGIGNIVDRIALGYVRDFLQFAFWEQFPVFNIADSFVTVGAFMLIVVLIVMLVKEGKKNQKEFEEQQAKVGTDENLVDPLDSPKNLNPMLKAGEDFTFEEAKDENKPEEKRSDEAGKDNVADTEVNGKDDSSVEKNNITA